MDIASLYKTLIDAAQLLGPIGAATAALSGIAKEAGAQAYKGVVAWFAQDETTGKPVQEQLLQLSTTPMATEVQTNLLQALTLLAQQRPEFLQSTSLLEAVSKLRNALPLASGGFSIGQQTAEKIVNVGVINGDIHL